MTENPADAGAAAAPLPPSPALATRPEALLLDFGGVVVETRRRPDALSEIAGVVAEELARAGHDIPPERLLPILAGGRKALKDWKNSASRRLAPRELTHREIWGDFYATPLPPAAREVLMGSAGALQQLVTLAGLEHTLRPGIRELVALAAELGVPLGIVSNAHSGRAHRIIMEREGLTEAFGVQVYSDEVGVRKPNPEMIEIAATALGTTPDRCWYVGDTYDRDVVAGRRAGVAAVVLTRHHHTDEVPFPVEDTPDAIFDTPEGLVGALRAAAPSRAVAAAPEAPAVESRSTLPSALLLDHGGVISVSVTDDGLRRGFAADLAARLGRAGFVLTPEQAYDAVVVIRAAHRSWKATHVPPAETPDVARAWPEIDATTFWVELAGPVLAGLLGGATGPGGPADTAVAGTGGTGTAVAGAGRADAGGTGAGGVDSPGEGGVVVPASLRAWLRAEAHALMVAYARAKSAPTVRPGVRELLVAARDAGVPVAVVSNTVNGRSVREELDAAGLTPLIGAHVYSDELGRRKPDPLVPATALRALAADPARAWFVGDKPSRDVLAARAAGVGHVVLVRGGSTSDTDLDAMPDDDAGRPDHVVDDMTALAPLLRLAPAVAGAPPAPPAAPAATPASPVHAPPTSRPSPGGRDTDPLPGS